MRDLWTAIKACVWVALSFGAAVLTALFLVQPAGAGQASGAAASTAATATTAATDAGALYAQHCAACHQASRLGAMGPALLPDNLARLRKPQALSVILEGRAATQMPAFAEHLSTAQAQALVDYIYAPPAESPRWQRADIDSCHRVFFAHGSLPDQPVFQADLLNLFIVVELGSHHATLLNGDTFEPIHRFKTHFALHGGPKYSADGRYVYFASRDGWISKFDIYNLKTVAEIRAGINTRNIAVSSDGKWVLVANYLPNNLVLLDAENLRYLDELDTNSRVSAVYTAPPRNSFIAALKDQKTVLEIPFGNRLDPVRAIDVEDYLDDFFFDASYKHLIATSRDTHNGQVIDLDLGKKVAEISLPGMPHLGSGISWDYQGRRIMATPNIKEGVVSFIDMQTWQPVKRLETLGPGFFMRSHENSRYAWTDVFFGPNSDAVHVIDKNTLEIVKTLRPAPGKVAAHVEFTRDGKYALLSIWDRDGAVVVYNGDTLEEIKRIPMDKPSGKYNVYNKTRYSEGTSH